MGVDDIAFLYRRARFVVISKVGKHGFGWLHLLASFDEPDQALVEFEVIDVWVFCSLSKVDQTKSEPGS